MTGPSDGSGDRTRDSQEAMGATQAATGDTQAEGEAFEHVSHGEDDPMLGRIFKDAYRVESLIGEGGMGAVYRGVQLAVGREVAIKVLRPSGFMNPQTLRNLVERFRREARATSLLSHPNTVRLIDFGEDSDGTLFLVLELLRGMALSDLITTEGALAPARVAHIGQQICRSLTEAHGAGIIHRDLKPDNVFICQFEDASDFVKVMDFGIARVAGGDENKTSVTRTGATVGTPSYMAPEQAMAGDITQRTDLYSLGIMLYQMLCGEVPFAGETFMQVALKHLNEDVPALRIPGVPPDVVEGWRALVMRLLEKDAEARPGSAREVGEALKELQKISAEAHIKTTPDTLSLPRSVSRAAQGSGEPKGARMNSAPVITMAEQSGVTRPEPRRRMGIWVAAAIIVVAGGATAAIALGGGDGQEPRLKTAANEASAETSKPAAVEPSASEAPEVEPAPEPEAIEAVAAKKEAEAQPEPEGGGEAVEVAAEPPKTAQLKLTSTPEGAAVTRGEETICTTPCDLEVPAGEGEETLTLALEGHQPAEIEVTLAAGATIAQSATLAPVARKGTAKRSTRKSRREARRKARAARRKARASKTAATKPARTPTSSEKTSEPRPKRKFGLPKFRKADPTGGK